MRGSFQGDRLADQHPAMVRMERYILESDLRALDEALRFSARTARCPEGDTGAEGMPPDEIQQHPVRDPQRTAMYPRDAQPFGNVPRSEAP